MNHIFLVDGMTCGHCVKAVTRAVGALDPSAHVVVDLGAGRVEIDSKLDPESLEAAIRAEGYTVRPSSRP
jgi:copper chaperone